MSGLFGAIEAGGTKFMVALARREGPVIEQVRIETGPPAETFAQVIAFLEAGAARHGPLAGIGIASFGPIGTDPAGDDYGRLLSTPKPGWEGVSYGAALARLGVPLAIDTDVNGAALGEWQEGAGVGCRTLAYTTVGTGIGTGVVHSGQPLHGFRHFEAGHIRVQHAHATDPYPGICPFHGDCLEGLASGPAIKGRFGKPLDELDDPGPAVELIAGYLSDLAVNLVLLHAPDRLIFGGGVMKTAGLVEALRRATVRKLAGYVTHPRLDEGMESYIQLPGLGDGAGIAGALALIRRAVAPGPDAS